MDGEDLQPRPFAIGRSIELSDQPIPVEDRQREVAPATFLAGLVHLEQVLEVEEGDRAGAIVGQAVER